MSIIDCIVFKQQKTMSHSILNIIVINISFRNRGFYKLYASDVSSEHTHPLPHSGTSRIYLNPLLPPLSQRYHLWMVLKKTDKIVCTFSSHFMCTPLYLHPQYSSVSLSEKRSKCIKNKMHSKEHLTYTECYSLITECSYI